MTSAIMRSVSLSHPNAHLFDAPFQRILSSPLLSPPCHFSPHLPLSPLPTHTHTSSLPPPLPPPGGRCGDVRWLGHDPHRRCATRSGDVITHHSQHHITSNITIIGITHHHRRQHCHHSHIMHHSQPSNAS